MGRARADTPEPRVLRAADCFAGAEASPGEGMRRSEVSAPFARAFRRSRDRRFRSGPSRGHGVTRRLEPLDSLRGLAALSVVIWHWIYLSIPTESLRKE